MELKALSKTIGARKARLTAFLAGKLPFEKLATTLLDWIWLLAHTSGRLHRRVWRQCFELAKQRNTFSVWLLLKKYCLSTSPYHRQIILRLARWARSSKELVYVYSLFLYDGRKIMSDAERQKGLRQTCARLSANLTTFNECQRLFEERLGCHLPVLGDEGLDLSFSLPDELYGLVLTQAVELSQTAEQCYWVAGQYENLRSVNSRLMSRPGGLGDFFDQEAYLRDTKLKYEALSRALTLAKTSAECLKIYRHCSYSDYHESDCDKVRAAAMEKCQALAKTFQNWLELALGGEGLAKECAEKQCLATAKTLEDYLALSNIYRGLPSADISKQCLALADTFEKCCQIIKESSLYDGKLVDKARKKALELAKTPQDLEWLYDHTSSTRLRKRILARIGGLLED